MQLANQQIIELVTITYTSNSTAQIQEAFNILVTNAYEIYPRSFKQLEDILASREYQIDANCKKAVANLIKVTGKRMLETISMFNKADDDWLNKHKKLLHAVQHILDNRQIQNTVKNPVVELYIVLFNHFSPENHTRLICKAKYYFNTKQYFLPICLIETYLAQDISYKHRFAFSEQNLELLVSESDKLAQIIVNAMRPLDYSILPILHRLFELLAVSWKQMTFEKYEKAYHKLFTDRTIINLISNLRNGVFSLFQKRYFHEIYSYIIESLGRCKLYNKYAQLMAVIRLIVVDELQDFLNGGEKESGTLTMLASAIQRKFIEIQLPSYDIFTKIIYPNYLCFSKYLQNQADNLPQVINFLDDATFYMQSEIVEVLRHKILYHLCRNCEEIWFSFKGLFYSYFCQHNSNSGNGEVKVALSNTNLQEGVETWLKIRQKVSQGQQLQIILLYTALSAKFFISEIEFMKQIEQFIFENQDHLLKNQNKKIVFYTLLLYKNYMDDIFNASTSVAFREKIISFAISNQSDHIFKEFSIDIIRQKLSQGPTYDQFSKEINLIVKDMTVQYRQYQIPIITLIFKEYGEFINSEDAITIIKESLSIWKGKEIYNDKKSSHLQLLKMFLNIRSCSDFYMHLIEEMLQIANQNVNLVQRHFQEVLQILVKGLETCKQLPENFQEILIKYQLIVNSIPMMETVNQLIMYSTSANFFNWLAVMLTKNNLNIYEILLIHNLIYFGNKKLTYESIKIIIEVAYLQRVYRFYEFDYRNGKINLIFLFLLKYNWKETNELLINEDWSFVKKKVADYTKNMRLLGKQEQFGSKAFIEQIYDFLYKMQNVYRWKYDIEMFLINQLDLFKYQISDHYQFMYANLSFLACTLNLLRAHEFIDMILLDELNDSDDSFVIQSKVQGMYREAEEILQHFTLPQHLKEADYFSVYRKTLAQLKKDENGNQWVETLFKAAFREQQYSRLETVLKIQKNPQGNYRKIQRIRRMRNNEENEV